MDLKLSIVFSYNSKNICFYQIMLLNFINYSDFL